VNKKRFYSLTYGVVVTKPFIFVTDDVKIASQCNVSFSLVLYMQARVGSCFTHKYLISWQYLLGSNTQAYLEASSMMEIKVL
jgi:hypothetical protein